MLLLVGRIGRPHGVRGMATVQVTTDSPEQRFAVGASLLTEPSDRGPLVVAHHRWSAGTLLLGFEQVGDRDSAEELRGTKLFVDSDSIEPPADPDTFADFQLVGLRAQDTNGAPLGEVTAVRHGPGGDRLVLNHEGRDILVPFVWAIVPEVDLAGGRVIVDPPEGLLDL